MTSDLISHFPLRINFSSFSLQQAVKCFNIITTLTSALSGAQLGNFSTQEFIKTHDDFYLLVLKFSSWFKL